MEEFSQGNKDFEVAWELRWVSAEIQRLIDDIISIIPSSSLDILDQLEVGQRSTKVVHSMTSFQRLIILD